MTDVQKNWSVQQENQQWVPFSVPSYLDRLDEFTFRCEFQLDMTGSFEKFFLRFNGVDGQCFVYLNNKILGGHAGGSVPFILAIPQNHLNINTLNELIVELDTRADFRSSVPLRPQVMGLPPAGGGIFKPVQLLSGSTVFLDSITIQLCENNSAHRLFLFENTQFSSSTSDRYRVQLFDGKKTGPVWQRTLRERDWKKGVPIHGSLLQPWKSDHPQIYRFKVVKNNLDELIYRFGYSHLSASADGKTIKDLTDQLKIIEWVYDKNLRRFSRQELKNTISQDLLSIKRLGANAVRVMAGIPPAVFLQECDSLGLYVLVELPLMQTPPRILDDQFFQQYSTVLKNMVAFAGKYPSVLAWGLGNGYDLEHSQSQKIIRRMTEFVHTLDHRPVYIAAGDDKIKTSPADFIILDVPERNEKHAGPVKYVENVIYRVVSLIPLVGRPLQEAEREQAFATSLELKRLVRAKTASVCVGPLRDWRGDMPHLYWGPRKEPYYFYAGILDRNGNPRPVFNIIQSSFLEREAHITLPLEAVREYRYVFQIMGFGLLLAFMIVFKSDRRLRKYLARIFLHPHGFYTDLCENRRVIPFLTFVAGSTVYLTGGILTASTFYYLRSSLLFDQILNWMVLDPRIKLKLVWLIWHPVIFVFVFTIIFFIITVLNTAVIKMFVYIQNRYLKWSQIMTLFLWVPAHFLFLLPVSIFFHRLLAMAEYRTPLAVLVGLFLIWFVIRFYRGIKVILQLSRLRAVLYLSGFLVTGLVLFFILEYARAFSAYVPYYFTFF